MIKLDYPQALEKTRVIRVLLERGDVTIDAVREKHEYLMLELDVFNTDRIKREARDKHDRLQ